MFSWVRSLPGALRHTLLYGTSIVLMKGVSLLMLPFIAHHLPADALGRLEVIGSLAIVGSILVGMGLEDALYRFIGITKDSRSRRSLAASLFGLSAVIGGSALLIAYLAAATIASWIPGLPSTYETRLVLAMLALEGCIAIPLGWLRMHDRAVHFFLFTTGRALLQALLVILFLELDRGVAGVLEAGLIAAVAQAVGLAAMQLGETGCAIDRETSRRAGIYSLPIVSSGLTAFTLNGMDRWILAEHASMADVAHFGVAAKFALAVALLLQPFGMWWSPRRFEVLHGEDGRRQAARMISIGLVLTLLITVVVGLSSPLLIAGLLPPGYGIAGQYAIALVLVIALREMAELVNLGCFTGDTTITQLCINLIGALVGLCGMLYWAGEHAVWGIIGALMLAQAVRLMLLFVASQYFLPLPYAMRSLLVMLAVGLACLGLGLFATRALEQILLIAFGTASLTLLGVARGLIPRPVQVFRP